MQQTPSPVAPNARIETLDVIRGFALLGILLMNIIGMGMLSAAYFHPLVGAGGAQATPLDLQLWFATELFAEGSMRALFSMLFGAGVLLFVTGARAKSAALHYRRTFWLFVFGLFDAFVLLWSGDILMVYAIASALLYFARHASARRLWVAAVALLVVNCAWHGAINFGLQQSRVAAQELNQALSQERSQTAETWLDFEAGAAPDAQQVATELKARSTSYASAFVWNAHEVQELLLVAVPSVLLWDALTMMLFGMALYKSGILTGARSSAFYRNLMLAGLIAGVAINFWETRGIQAGNYDLLATFGYSQVTYDLGRLGLALGYIGLLGWVIQRDWLRGARRRLAAVGRMALTNYLMHSGFALFLFTGAGLGLVGQLDRLPLYAIVAGIWLFQLWYSPWWLARHTMGPAETLWRRLTYGATRAGTA